MAIFSNEEYNILKEQMKTQGYKLTPQRRAVLDVVVENEGKHLSTEEVYDIVKIDCPEIGLATVYRTLQLLEKIGVICKLNFDDGCSRYELVHSNETHQHHHLICNICGSVEEVEDVLLESLENKVETKYDFKITNHDVKFYGICTKCSKKDK
ncbi:Fur family transcriptional regulator [Clostridium cylindrosporum]|uniref:Ferric uptake regulation protein Fur n=1 Tax=Clostridium cylindrosporum DSM 605 TaxID=1121307 RepID=A0A0J8D625_CLOCY|nr:Fur family transcriptional regulator [Clostridium cylindrosporum]KMT21307.1 ferric uptake regulation protein Fur [Clostridium cylindrosporum DSM 605]